MKFEAFPFTFIDWDECPMTEHLGSTGTARVRTVEVGEIRVRMVHYSAGYLADHWCDRGHVVFVVEGSCTLEIQDGRAFFLTAGQSFAVGDGIDLHRVSTTTGCEVFVVD